MNVKILGTGCAATAAGLEGLVEDPLPSGTGLGWALEKVSRMSAIMSYGIMRTPGLVIDGELKESRAARCRPRPRSRNHLSGSSERVLGKSAKQA